MDAASCYLEGNNAFKTQLYVEASRLYSDGIVACDKQNNDLLIKLYLNRSQSYIFGREYELAKADCDFVLSRLDQYNIKALLRRSTCYEYIGNIQRAYDDCNTIIENSQEHDYPASLVTTTLKHRNILDKLVKQDNVEMSKTKLDNLVTPNQVLRLIFTEPPPPTVELNGRYKLKLVIGNEFGLYDRKNSVSGNNKILPTLRCGYKVLDEGDTSNFRISTSEASILQLPVDARFEIDVCLSMESEVGTRSVSKIILYFYLDSKLPSGKSVEPIYSLPILVQVNPSVTVDKEEELITKPYKLGASCIREMQLCSHSFFVYECPFSIGIGGKVWDSSYVLVDYLLSSSESVGSNGLKLLRGKRVVELGSGTGALGFTLSMFEPSSCILTDLGNVVPLLTSNLELNCLIQPHQHVVQTLRNNFKCHELAWGVNTQHLSQQVDVIVASDVVYDPTLYEPLCNTLLSMLNGTNICLMAHRHRHPNDKLFFTLLNDHNLNVTPIFYDEDRDVLIFVIRK